MIKVKILNNNAKVPIKNYNGDAGFDLFAMKDVHIPHMKWEKIPVGIAVEIPLGTVLLVQEKSGMASKLGLMTIGNVIDASYRGEIHVILFNFGDDILIRKGQKIAQALLLYCYTGKEIEVVNELSITERNDSGFGSTGDR